jgi:translation initiation factor 1
VDSIRFRQGIAIPLMRTPGLTQLQQWGRIREVRVDPEMQRVRPLSMSKKRIATDGGASFGHNPFGHLSGEGLASGPRENQPAAGEISGRGANAPRKNRGRVDILRQTAHRGGKTVTVVTGFVGIGLPEKEKLAKEMQKACGTGGTVKEGRIEIQGDKRAEAARILTEAGFRPVFAGG